MIGDWISMGPALAGGFAIGLFYFGGLRLTVGMLTRSARPALWVAVSFLLRSAAAVYGFYWIAGGRRQSWLVCLLGFLLARAVLLHRARSEMKTDRRRMPQSGTAAGRTSPGGRP